MAEDWEAVASAISGRLAELRTTQMDVAARARISLTTLRELQHNTSPRQRRPQTLAAVSEALGWPSGYLTKVLHGEDAGLIPTRRGIPCSGRWPQLSASSATSGNGSAGSSSS